MAFDRSSQAQLIVSPAPVEQSAPINPVAQQTILQRVAAREATQAHPRIAPAAAQTVTFADVLFGAVIITLSILAALLGITAALFLIGLGLAIFILPIIAGVFVGVVAATALVLCFRKQIRQFAVRMSHGGKVATPSAGLFEAA